MKIVPRTEVADANLAASNVLENDYTAYSATQIYVVGDRVRVVSTDVHEVYEAVAGEKSVVTITVASPGVVSWTAHGLAEDTPIVFTTTGALPTGLTAGTTYYVLSPTTNDFNVAATVGGGAINTSGPQSGVHTAGLEANYNKTPADNPEAWVKVGATNRWRMFDAIIQAQTENADSIDVTLNVEGRINEVLIFNAEGAEAQVILTDAIEGVVYDMTQTLVSSEGVTGMYAWLFEPIRRKDRIRFGDLPPYLNPTLQIIISWPGQTAKCGECLFGLGRTLGDTQWGIELGITDYSRKERDDFGNLTIVERGYSDLGRFTFTLPNTQVATVKRFLTEIRATPCGFIGAEEIHEAGGAANATLSFGIPQSFRITIPEHPDSLCTLDVESLI